jgi:flagellin
MNGFCSSATQTNEYVNFTNGDSNVKIMQLIGTAMEAQGFSTVIDSNGMLNVSGNGATYPTSAVAIGGSGAGLSTVAGSSIAIATVTGAIAKLNINSSYFGSKLTQIQGLISFTESQSNALQSGIGALTDADMAAESAKLQSLQTKQSLAIQSLSIANQQPQAIMSLFR